jgi:hypothetical protein
MHKDVRRCAQEVVEQYKCVLVHASYLLGQIDGSERTVEKAAPKALGAMTQHEYLLSERS